MRRLATLDGGLTVGCSDCGKRVTELWREGEQLACLECVRGGSPDSTKYLDELLQLGHVDLDDQPEGGGSIRG